jgi:hypothetical protein
MQKKGIYKRNDMPWKLEASVGLELDNALHKERIENWYRATTFFRW